MENLEQKELVAMITVVYQKLNDIEGKLFNSSSYLKPVHLQLEELREKAAIIIDQIL